MATFGRQDQRRIQQEGLLRPNKNVSGNRQAIGRIDKQCGEFDNVPIPPLLGQWKHLPPDVCRGVRCRLFPNRRLSCGLCADHKKRNSVLVNGSSSNCCCTRAARPPIPFRRSVYPTARYSSIEVIEHESPLHNVSTKTASALA